jgi:filamentous hemagglutinin family protein
MVRDMLSSRRRLLAGSALTGVLAMAMPAGANPTDPTIVHGTVGFAENGTVLEVTQGSDKAIIDWRSFSIANGEVTRFIQSGSGAIALNRVTGDQASVLNGQLTANGQIFLINPNGILFGAGAQVDVAGLVATTADIDNEAFLAGDYSFNIASPLADAAVINEGSINAGLVALVAPSVRNSGTIVAELGTVSLGAAQRFTLDLAGDGLISFDAGSAVDGAKLEQAGRISGATVLLSAATAARVVDNVIDMTGVVEARGAYQDGGDIVLDGGQGAIAVSGTLDASGEAGGGTIQVGSSQTSRLDVTATALLRADATQNGNGGNITLMSGDYTHFAGSISATGAGEGQGGFAEVSSAGSLSYQGTADLTAQSGIKGTLLLDPKNIIVAATGSDDVAGNDGFGENAAADTTLTAAAVVAALDGANLVLQANNDISVNAAIDASANAGAGNLTLQAGRSVALNADVTLNGSLSVLANDSAALAAQRDAGTGFISVASGVTITTSGAQSYQGDLLLAGNLVGSGGGSIDITGTLTVSDLASIITAGGSDDNVTVSNSTNGTGFLLVDAGAGTVSLGDVGTSEALSGLSLNGGTLILGSVTTTGLQDYAGAVRLAGDLVSTSGGSIRLAGPVTLTGDSAIVTAGAAGDDIRFTSTVNGGFALVTDAGKGAVTFSGAVGGTTALEMLSAGGATVTLGSVTTTGLQDYAGVVRLGGDLVSTSGGSIRLAGPVTLTGDSAIVTAGAAGDDIRFTSTVNGGYALVTDAGEGAVTFGGAVGGTTALEMLSAGGATVTLGSVTTTGLQDYAGAVRLGGDLVSTSGGSIRLAGPVTLTGDSAIVTAGAAGDDIRFTSTVNGGFALVTDAGKGAVTFSGAVGGTTALEMLSAGGATVTLGSVTTTGLQDYAGAVRLGGDLVSTSGGGIRLAGPVTLTGDSAIVTAGAAGDDIRFTSTVNGGYALVTDAGKGAVTFGGAVGSTTALEMLSAGGATVTLGSVTTTGLQDYAGAVRLGGDLVSTTGGGIRLAGAVTLTGNSRITSAGVAGDTISLTGAVSGPYQLTIRSGKANTTLAGAVSGLSGLDVSGATVGFAAPVAVTGTLVANATRLTTGTLSATTITLTGTEALTAGTISASQDVTITAGKGATLSAIAGRMIAITAGSSLTTGAVTATQDITVKGATDVALGVLTGRNLALSAGTALTVAGINAENATLTAGTSLTGTGALRLSKTLELVTNGKADAGTVQAGALTYRGSGLFSANGSVAGISGDDAADLVQVAGSRTGTYLFAGRPVFGIGALVERQRLDVLVADSQPETGRDDGRLLPLLLDPAGAAAADPLITFKD